MSAPATAIRPRLDPVEIAIPFKSLRSPDLGLSGTPSQCVEKRAVLLDRAPTIVRGGKRHFLGISGSHNSRPGGAGEFEEH
jgi:hypothetical protein